MAAWRWIRVGLLAILLAAPARAQNASQPAAPSAEQLIAADNARLRRILTDPASTPEKRDDAARRLATRGPGQLILLAILRNPANPRDIRLSAAKGATDVPTPNNDAVAEVLNFAKEVNQVPAIREPLIRAMGNMVDPKIADFLISILPLPAAADSLTQMTGLPYGVDVKRWGQWQASNAPKPSAEWIAQVKADHRIHIEQMRHSGPLDEELSRLFRGMSRDDKEKEMARFLESADPQLQLLGLRIVTNLHESAQPRPAAADRLIPELLSDGDLEVRTAAARVVHDINLVGALDAILVQLPQEVDDNVKELLADDLGPINDLRAVEVLTPLLKDPSLKVAGAAAHSLGMLGDAYRQKSPAGAKALANQLWLEGNRRPGPDGTFLAACIEALAPLRDSDRFKDLQNLCFPAPQRPTAVRIAALHAVGELPNQDPTWFNALLANAINDPPTVRAATVKAIGQAGKFGVNAAPLFDLTKPTNEPDKTVRDDAWNAFKILLPTATDSSLLKSWADQLKDDPDHKRVIAVMEALNAKLLVSTAPNHLDDLADSHQSTGQAYERDGQLDKAVENYQLALKHWDEASKEEGSTELLVGQIEDALLNNRKYRDACTFAAERIAKDNRMLQTVGPRIVDKAAHLADATDDPQQLEDVGVLQAEVMKMNPSLDERRRKTLADYVARANETLARLRKRPPQQ
jgi:HEAT repeat protein